MTTTELKNNLHEFIDRIDNEDLLHALYELLKGHVETKPGELWASLTEDQKAAVLASYEESEDDDKLIPNEDVFD